MTAAPATAAPPARRVFYFFLRLTPRPGLAAGADVAGAYVHAVAAGADADDAEAAVRSDCAACDFDVAEVEERVDCDADPAAARGPFADLIAAARETGGVYRGGFVCWGPDAPDG